MRRLTAPIAAAVSAVLFALDYRDPELYVATFTEDGILDVGSGEIKGRAAIKETIARMPQPAPTAGMRPAVGRHNISNIVIRVDGKRRAAAPTGFTTRTTTRNGRACSTASVTTKTSS